MDAQQVSEPQTRHKRKFPDGLFEFLDDDLKSCKYLKIAAPSTEPQSTEICEQVSALQGNCRRVSVQQDALNFQRSGVPTRFLYYDKGHWRDFSQELLPSIFASFVARKSSTRLSIGDNVYILNFIYMIQVNMRTGFARSIAWVDRRGALFTPSKCIEQSCVGLLPKLLDGRDQLSVEALQDGVKSSNIDNSLRSPQTETTRCDSVPKCCEFAGLGEKLIKLAEDEQDFLFARDKFLSGFSLFARDAIVTGIYKNAHTGISGQARHQAFNIQEGITATARGDSDVRYAWHGTSREGVFGIIQHGFGQPRIPKNGDTFGVGVYLAPEDASHVSAMYSEVDEKGEQHVLLCKVIMGRMEQVCAGSQQFHPSTEEFDTGVDDLRRPRRYIVWSTHMNTHILPVFIISFKLSTMAREVIVAAQRRKHVLRESFLAKQSKKDCESLTDAGVMHIIRPHFSRQSLILTEHSSLEAQANSCTSGDGDASIAGIDESHSLRVQENVSFTSRNTENMCSNVSNGRNVPRSPWISFPELFPLLESKVQPKEMIKLQKLREDFQVGKLPRSSVVETIRHMLGDDFLRECIKNRRVHTQSSNCTRESFCG